MSSHRAEETVAITPKFVKRREYPTDLQHISENQTTIVGKIRRDRLLQGISAKTLSKMAGMPIRTVSRKEEHMTPDDELSTDYLKRIAVTLGFEETRYMDEYLMWADSDRCVSDVQEYVRTSGCSLEQLYRRTGIGECAMNNWKNGVTRPSRKMYELIMGKRKEEANRLLFSY